jgi:hypothetical protein
VLNTISKLNGYKTYIVAAASVVYALVSYWNGTLDGGQAQDMVQTALLGLTIRHGIAKALS